MSMMTKKLQLQQGETLVTLTPFGDIQQLKYGQLMINQLIHHPLDGSLMNFYVRFNGGEALPLLGIASPSTFELSDSHIRWSGDHGDFSYTVIALVHPDGLRFDLSFDGEGRYDVTYTQDLGLADEAGVRTNEAYMAQYIDYAKYDSVLLARQNQQQSTGFPGVLMACSEDIAEYATDGFDVYGTDYRKTNRPEGLNGRLASRIYQYEFALPTIRTREINLSETDTLWFELRIAPHLEEALSEDTIGSMRELGTKPSLGWEKLTRPFARIQNTTLSGDPVSEDRLQELYPDRQLEEYVDGQLLSFFTPDGGHVVLQEKERLVERSHGNILLTAGSLMPAAPKLATTVFMNGVFNSHIVWGNTNYNKWMTNIRNPLNIPKTSGQRIYVEYEGTNHLLTLPSLFEMGMQEAVWHYFIGSETITVRTVIGAESPVIQLSINSTKPLRFKVSQQIAMHTQEYVVPFQMQQQDKRLLFSADPAADSSAHLPDLTYTIEADQQFTIRQSSDGFDRGFEDDLIWMQFDETNILTLRLGVGKDRLVFEEQEEKRLYDVWMNSYRNGLHFESKADKWQAMDMQVRWYVQNMRIHYQSPHGLEQYGGAAWGTRDVSQGPMEFLLATGHFEEARALVLMIFSHQFEAGDWPQWFMFDEYEGIQQEDSHGDVIVWPLKAVSDYLIRTNDLSCLEEIVPFRNKTGEVVSEKSLVHHIEQAIQKIEDDFVGDSVFSAYGGGDWDDTLQPADEELKRNLISTWTVALTYQVMDQLSSALSSMQPLSLKLGRLSGEIKRQFEKDMILDDVIPGFLHVTDQGYQPMIHPSDETLRMKYRLLPMTRSIISELVSKEQANQNMSLIAEHLKFPDGVRLMDKPAAYRGGVSHHFMRAEQAANFGREIGLQYVHAHIRYIEALAKLGRSAETVTALEVINPVLMTAVPNAALRQRNAYFSSSDGDFKTRYEAQDQFNRLKEGSVAVKGGWRIYSSGPGIWFNQLLSHVLGIRIHEDELEFDPVVSEPVEFSLHLFGTPYQIQIKQGNTFSVACNGQELTGTSKVNPYRTAGRRVSREELEQKTGDNNRIIITVEG